jgi:branched-chain amino acid transport system substrate-binding protein
LLGIEKAKTTDSKAIVESLESLRLMDGTMPSYIRAFDHQVVRRFLVVGIKEHITDKWDYFDILEQAPKDAAGLEPLFGTKEEIGCTMGDL